MIHLRTHAHTRRHSSTQTTIFRNLSYPDLAKHEEANKEVSQLDG